MSVKIQPELSRFRPWSKLNTAFSSAELEDLRRDFNRFSDSLDTHQHVLHKKWFKKHILHIKVDDSNRNDRTRSFLADMIYQYFADPGTDWLTIDQYMGASELLIKGSIEDKLMWLYAMLLRAHQMRAAAPVAMRPVEIRIPQSPNMKMSDPIMTMRAVMSVVPGDAERHRAAEHVVDPEIFHGHGPLSPMQHKRTVTPPLSHDNKVNSVRSMRLQSIALDDDHVTSDSDTRIRPRPLRIPGDQEHIEDPSSVEHSYVRETLYLADSYAGYTDVRAFVDMFFGQSTINIEELGYAGFESLCRRVLQWYKKYEDALQLFLPNRQADSCASHAPEGAARFESSEMDLLKGILVRYSAFEDDNGDWWVSQTGLSELLREMLDMTGDQISHRIVESFQTEYSRRAARTDAVISFDQCIRILSILMRGNSSEKYGLLFQLADIDGDGRITRHDLQSTVNLLMTAIAVQGDTLRFAEQQLVEAMFDEYNYDGPTGAVSPSRRRHQSTHRSQHQHMSYREFVDSVHRWELRARMIAVIHGLLVDITRPDAFVTRIDVDGMVTPEPVVPPSELYMYCMLFVVVNASVAGNFIGGVPGVMGTQLITSMGIASSQLGLLGSMQSIGLLPGFFVSKWMAHRFSLRTALIINGILQMVGGITIVMAGQMSIFGLMLMGFLVVGLGDNGFVISLCINRHFPTQLGFCFALYSVVSALSVVISATSLQPVMGAIGMMGTLWYMFGWISFSASMCVLFAVLEPHALVGSVKAGDGVSKSFSLSVLLQRINYMLPMRRSGALWNFLKQIRSMPASVWLIYLHSILTGGGTGTLQTFGASYYQQQYGMSKFISAFIVPGFYSITVIVLSPFIGRIFDKRGYRLTMLNGAAMLLALAFVIMYTVKHPAVPWIVSLMGGTVSTISRGIGNPTMALLVPENLVPEAMLLYGLLLNSGTIIEGNVAGYIMSQLGYNAIWAFCLIISCITCATALIITVINWRTSASSLQVPQHRTRMSMVLPKQQELQMVQAATTPHGHVKKWLAGPPSVRARTKHRGHDPSSMYGA